MLIIEEHKQRIVNIRCVNVYKIFRQANLEVIALKGVNLDIYAGEIVVIMGPSGSGKTTLLNVISGMDRTSAGNIFIRGYDITRMNDQGVQKILQNEIGIVFQFFNLIPSLTAEGNIELPMTIASKDAKFKKERVKQLIQDIDLEDGQVIERLDIRQPVRLEMEFEVLKPGHVLLPHYNIFNEEGIELFSAHDLDPEWRGRHRPLGRYVSTAWVPGNFFAEGTIFVAAAMITLNPNDPQFYEADVVAFNVVESFGGDSARGDWHKHMSGVVRPMLNWSTEFYPQDM